MTHIYQKAKETASELSYLAPRMLAIYTVGDMMLASSRLAHLIYQLGSCCLLYIQLPGCSCLHPGSWSCSCSCLPKLHLGSFL